MAITHYVLLPPCGESNPPYAVIHFARKIEIWKEFEENQKGRQSHPHFSRIMKKQIIGI